jgi:hypothetical protein
MWLKSISVCTLCSAVGCSSDPLIDLPNEAPVADAKVIVNGVAMEQARDGSIAALTFPFSGAPLTVTLDGTGSRDPDGEIVSFRWLSGTRIPDAGAPRPWTADAGVPEPFWRVIASDGESPWPAPVAAPSVELGEGAWAFTLWVADDDGAWSSSDTVRFTIGRASGAMSDGGVARSTLRLLDGGIDGGH